MWSGAGDLVAVLDDLVHEKYVRAYRDVGRILGQCRFRTWLLTIGGNVLKDAARRAKRSRAVPLGEDVRATDGDPHERAVAGEAGGRPPQGLGALARVEREGVVVRAPAGLAF